MATIEKELQLFSSEPNKSESYRFSDTRFVVERNPFTSETTIAFRQNPYSIFSDVRGTPETILDKVTVWLLRN